MSYASEQAQFNEDVLNQSTTKPQVSSTFGENFIQGVGQTIDKGLSISSQIVRATGGWSLDERNDEIRAMRKSGEIDDDVYTSFIEADDNGLRAPNYNALAEYLRSKGSEIRTDKMINDDMRQTLKERTAIANDVFSRQGASGFVGEMAGGLVGFGLEPSMLAAVPLEAYFIGRAAFTLSQATTRLGRAARIGGISAATNAGVEAGIQPILFNWREEIGQDMSWSEAIINVASVGVMSGAITGLASSLKGKARFEAEQMEASIKEKMKVDNGESLDVREVASILKSVKKATKDVADDPETDAYIKTVTDELDSVPEGVTAKEHFERVEAAEKRVNSMEAIAKQEINDLEKDVIDSAQLDTDFETAITDDLYLNDLALKDLSDIDPQQGMFGFDELDYVSKKDVGDAIGQIENADKKAKQLETCILGSEAPF